MIPKTIHYCWFGRNPLPESAVKCIDSWRKFFPDYEVKEWNEDNFDVNSIPYTQQAYKAKKYAFVSDYARFWILYHYGGIYFDTDVEVIKPMGDIIAKGPFMGIETIGIDTFKSYPLVNPGLGVAAEPGMVLFHDILEHYALLLHLNDINGNLTGGTVVTHTTRALLNFGLQPTGSYQYIADISIYPADFFNPYDDLTGRLVLTDNTRSIHWYSASWNKQSPYMRWMSRMSHRIFGLYIHYAKNILKRKLYLIKNNNDS